MKVQQLITELNKSYDIITTLIQQMDPLPTFYEARSKLILETGKTKQALAAENTATTALVSTAPSGDRKITSSPNKTRSNHSNNNNSRGRGYGNHRDSSNFRGNN